MNTEPEELVLADEFCYHHHIDLSFIQSLHQSGLIQLTLSDEKLFLPISELSWLQQILRMHYELDINLEGIETITHLLKRMNQMQQQIRSLRNKLGIYERCED